MRIRLALQHGHVAFAVLSLIKRSHIDALVLFLDDGSFHVPCAAWLQSQPVPAERDCPSRLLSIISRFITPAPTWTCIVHYMPILYLLMYLLSLGLSAVRKLPALTV